MTVSRDFETSSTTYAEITSAIVGAAPFSFACWIRPESRDATYAIFSIAVNGSGNNFFRLDQTSGNLIRFRRRASSDVDTTVAFASISTATWYLVAVSVVSATDGAVYVNTTKQAYTALSVVPSGMNRTSIARATDTQGAGRYDGLIAMPTIWNVALSDANIASLAGGDHPLTVANGNIVSHWAFDETSPADDLVGSNDLTYTGSPPVSATWPPVDNRYSIPVKAITVAKFAPSATVTELGLGHTSALPVKAITVAKNNPSATVTEKNFSSLPAKAIAVASYAPTATKTDRNYSAIPVKAIAVAGYAPGASITEHNRSAIPVKTIALASHAPGATVTTVDGHTSALPSKSIAVAALAPTVTITERHTSSVPRVLIAVNALAPTATKTERNYSAIPVAAIILEAAAMTATTGDTQRSSLPVAALNLTAYSPGATLTENHQTALPVKGMILTAYAPSTPAQFVAPSVTVKAKRRDLESDSITRDLERMARNAAIIKSNDRTFTTKSRRR